MKIEKLFLLCILMLLSLIFIDQFFKIYIKLHFNYGEKKSLISHWLLLFFVENEGMALGRKYTGDFGKIILTTIRILHSIILFYLLYYLIKQKFNFKIILIVIFLLAGNLSNTIDNLFYASIFTNNKNGSNYIVSHPIKFKKEKLFLGKAVDYIYINKMQYPQWVPLIGNKNIVFLDVVFNLADIYIYLSIIGIIFYYKKIVKTIYLIQLKWLND